MARALEGLKIVECGNGLSAPFAAKLLCEMGAEVIKVEAPGAGDVSRGFGPFPGDVNDREKSAMFHYLNAGKQSVTLDINSAAGRKLLHGLCAGADALLVNGDVAQLEASRLTYADWSAVLPQLVLTTITPFGFTGPYSRLRGHDITLCALGGVSNVVGEPGRAPLTPPLSLSAYQAGMAAASATLLALFARKVTGRGQHVDISPLDVWVTVHQGTGFTNFVNFGRDRTRAGRRRNEPYPYHFLEASDGLMCLIARDGHQWKRFIDMVGIRELIDNPRYADRVAMGLKYPAEVDALLQPWFAQKTRAEVFELCRGAHIPFAPVRHIDEVAACSQLAARSFFVQLPATADGTSMRVPGVPYQFGATPAAITRPAPRLGEHTGALLAGLGFDAQAQAGLARAGVI